MNKFKIGDKVRRVSGTFNGMRVGDTGTVVGPIGSVGILLKEYVGVNDPEGIRSTHSTFSLVLVEDIKYYPNPPHIHQGIIIEWAKGADIQYLNDGLGWRDTISPTWGETLPYRVKPVVDPSSDNSEEIIKLKKELEEISNRLKELSS